MASELLWRRVSEAEKKQIEDKAKRIMLDFGKTLEKLPKVKEAVVERESFMREESEGKTDSERDSDFRKIMFDNAPNKEGECIVAEKGKWVEK